jgi:HAD superfamily hydrolase (TIGR01458 family)
VSVDFAGVKGFLFDMDGVWFVGDRALPGAAETLALIRARGLPCRFITNTTTKPQAELAAMMTRMGLPVDSDEVVSASRATALHLRALGTPSCHLIVADEVRPEFDAFPSSRAPDFVVVGDVGARWSYALLNDAFRVLVGGADLIAMHRGKYWQVADGLALDIGAFVAGLEYATGKTATLVGKPAPAMFRSALADMGLEPADVVMVGDDVYADVGGAQGAGIRGVLVETGKYREELVSRSGVTPDAVIASIAELRAYL